jgi:excinuclease UvrABC ATPase subunit
MKAEFDDFVRSEYCCECGGTGAIQHDLDDYQTEYIQCESCEDLHLAEVRADRMQDEWAGN